MKIEEAKEQPNQQSENHKNINFNDSANNQSKIQKRRVLKINSKMIQLFDSER